MNNDLISRQAAIDEIKALYEWHDTVTEDRTIDHLKRLPSAQPEQRTGVWIQNSPFAKPYCSRCLKDCFGLHGFDYTATAYCPNCGAKMEVEDDA